MRYLRLLMCLFSFTFSFFPFVDCTTRHSHRSASSQTTYAVLVGSPNAPKVAPPSTHTLQPRARSGYSSFLSIGSGWNLYYSSWAGSLLPIRTYIPELLIPLFVPKLESEDKQKEEQTFDSKICLITRVFTLDEASFGVILP